MKKLQLFPVGANEPFIFARWCISGQSPTYISSPRWHTLLQVSATVVSLLFAYAFSPALCFTAHSCTSRRWKYIQDEWCLQDKNTSISHPEFTVATYCWYIFNKQKSNFSLFQLKISQNVEVVPSLGQELMADSQPVCWMGVCWDSFCKLL